MFNKQKLYKIIFESDTKAGKYFDVFLLWVILASVIVAIFDSIPGVGENYSVLLTVEWVFTVIFSLEYLLRIIVSPKPVNYVFSFWGIVDLLAVLPTYISLLFTGAHFLIIVRIIRLLRVFRILRLFGFYKESINLLFALKTGLYKIGVFLSFVVVLVIVLGTLMYVVEGGQNGFTSIPQSIYWAIITITTVGYGDIVPITIAGKIIASLTMIIGYAIIAVPTGIVTVEITKANRKITKCSQCKSAVEDTDLYCRKCGKKLQEPER